MEFFIKLKIDGTRPIPILFAEQAVLNSFEANILYLLGNGRAKSIKEIRFASGRALFLGDPVFHDANQHYLQDCFEKTDIGSVIKSVDGFYFLMIVHDRERRLLITSSLFGILPVYLAHFDGMFFISSSFSLIMDQTKSRKHNIDEQYYLEKSLFNYPLFQRTPIREISTLPANTHLEYANAKISLKKHLFMSDCFSTRVTPWRKSLDGLSDLFIARAKAFLPDEPFIATLTGGFDGRTVIGLALSQGKQISSYSYGSGNDLDIAIPRKIAAELKFDYEAVFLDEVYAREHYLPNAQEFVVQSNGLGNLSRAHYHYALESKLKNFPYLLTGNFGSEIIRTMKIPGVMASSLLFDMFGMKDQKDFQDKIRAYPGIRYLNPDLVNDSIDSLFEEIRLYLTAQPENLTINKRFYIYMFEEVFRKYFGPEIMVQRYFLRNRSPYLCFSFIEELLKTEIAGANGEFMETNPFKRFHGQVLYAHILKKTFPKLLHMPLDRGYKPNDFLTVFGPLNIMAGYFKRNCLTRRDKNLPSYATLTHESNLDQYRNIALDHSVFDGAFFNAMMNHGWKGDQMNFINMLSAAFYLNVLANKVSN